MATATLTPTAYYQLEGDTITAKNPTDKELWLWETAYNKSILIEFTIPSDADYAHGVVSANGFVDFVATQTTQNRGMYMVPVIDYSLTTAYVGMKYTKSENSARLFSAVFSKDYYEERTRFTTIKTVSNNKIFIWISNAEKDYEGVEDNGHYSGFIRSLKLQLTYTTSTSNFKTTMNPSSGFVNPIKANTFTFSVTAPTQPVLTPYKIANGTFHYKLSSASSYTSNAFTGNKYTLPANSFSAANTYSVYAILRDANGESSITSTYTFNTNDSTPSVTLSTPVNETIRRTATFKWNYSVSTGMPQYAYDLQYSTNGGTSWTTSKNHIVTSATSVSLIFTTVGEIYWRVRVYNQNNVASAWSDPALFVNIVPPSAPTIIDVTSGGRPSVTWSSDSQIAYQVQLLQSNKVLIDSGIVYSTNTNYKFNDYVMNGSYTIRVRVFNKFGNSNWTTYNYFQTYDLIAPEYYINNTDDGVRIDLTNADYIAKTYIERNGELVAKFTGTTYTDLYSVGETHYKLVFVDWNDYAVISEITLNSLPNKTKLIDEQGNILNINKRWNQQVIPQMSIEQDNSSNLYYGSKKPEINTNNMKIRRFSIAVDDRELNILNGAWIGKRVFFKSIYGIGGWCVILAINTTTNRIVNETVIDLSETINKSEVIEYEL